MERRFTQLEGNRTLLETGFVIYFPQQRDWEIALFAQTQIVAFYRLTEVFKVSEEGALLLCSIIVT